MKLCNSHSELPPITFDFNDSVNSIDIDKNLLISGQDGMVIPVNKIKSNVDLEMKIVSQKFDEIVKNENVESGVEDSDLEEEK